MYWFIIYHPSLFLHMLYFLFLPSIFFILLIQGKNFSGFCQQLQLDAVTVPSTGKLPALVSLVSMGYFGAGSCTEHASTFQYCFCHQDRQRLVQFASLSSYILFVVSVGPVFLQGSGVISEKGGRSVRSRQYRQV